MVLIYSQLTTPITLLIGGAIMGIFVNGMLGGYGAIAVGALSDGSSRNRGKRHLQSRTRGRRLWSVRGGALAVSYSFTVAIALLATIYLVDIAATAFLIPARKGAPLE